MIVEPAAEREHRVVRSVGVREAEEAADVELAGIVVERGAAEAPDLRIERPDEAELGADAERAFLPACVGGAAGREHEERCKHEVLGHAGILAPIRSRPQVGGTLTACCPPSSS